MKDELLSLSGVHTHIGAYHILHGVDLAVPRGQLTMLLGRNGAGKSTTLKAISNLIKTEDGRVSAGRIDFGGQAITGHEHVAPGRKHDPGPGFDWQALRALPGYPDGVALGH